jgi:hypothetical protein
MRHHLALAGMSFAGAGLTSDPAACTRGRPALHRAGAGAGAGALLDHVRADPALAQLRP